MVLGWAGTVVEFGLHPAGILAEDSGPTVVKPAVAGGAQPHVTVDADVYDFGTMPRDTTQHHVFVLKNTGQAPLHLELGSTSCKCTLSQLAQNAIPPGESGEVTVEWTASNREGPFRQRATILTNDPQQSRVELSITGRVISSYVIVPDALVFGSIGENASPEAQARVYSFQNEPLKVTDVQLADGATFDFFDVHVAPLTPAERDDPDAKSGCSVTVRIKPGLPAGRIHQKIRLVTNLPITPTLEIPLEGKITSDLSVVGANWNDDLSLLNLGSVRSQDGFTTKLWVRVNGPYRHDVKLSVAEVDPDSLHVTIGEAHNEGMAVVVPLTVEIPKGARPSNHLGSAQGGAGHITLNTNHPDSKHLAPVCAFRHRRGRLRLGRAGTSLSTRIF